MKKKLFVSKYLLIVFLLLILLLGHGIVRTTYRTEDFYAACEIIREDAAGYTNVVLPSGTEVWIEIVDEVVNAERTHVVLHVVHDFNILNQMTCEYVLDTILYAGYE